MRPFGSTQTELSELSYRTVQQEGRYFTTVSRNNRVLEAVEHQTLAEVTAWVKNYKLVRLLKAAQEGDR